MCSLIRHAYDRSFTKQNIQASFRRSGIWPLDHTKLLNVVRPSTAGSAASIMSPEDLYDAFKKRQEEMRGEVLGSDANIGRSGFIDTFKGSVVTSSKALELARMKHASNVKTFEENAAKEAWRAAKQDGRARAAARESQNFHNYRTRRRAAMAGMCLEEHTASVRSLTRRWAVAWMRTNRGNH